LIIIEVKPYLIKVCLRSLKPEARDMRLAEGGVIWGESRHSRGRAKGGPAAHEGLYRNIQFKTSA
jgi:hypothetical protein